MIQFARATAPTKLKDKRLALVSFALAAWTIALAAAQMVSFEDFSSALQQYQFGSFRVTLVVAIALLGAEVFSVPFLLRLWLSPAARYLSGWLALLAPAIWLELTLSAMIAGRDVVNAGYLGGFLPIPVGPLAIFIDVVWLGVIVVSFRSLGGGRFEAPKR